MALNHSPKIVTDGLVFAYDMGNAQKSWKGMPTTNQFTLPTGDTNGFGVQNSTFTRVRTGNYGGYEINPTDYVWRYNVTGNDCPYHGWDIPTTAGAVVTFSFDYYVDPSTTNYPVTNYLANFENAGSGVGGSIADPTPSIKGVWKRAYFSSTATATGNSRCLLYPGACGGRLGDAGFILYKNPQVEFNAPGSIPTPFVAGTRSNTQALVDLTGNNTITANSLTYTSDGTFSFNGTSDRLTSSTSLFNRTNGQEITVSCWIKPSRLGGQYSVFCTNRSSDAGTYNWIFYQHANDGAISFHGSSQYKSTYIPVVNTWVNVTNTVTSAGVSTLYVNGVSTFVVNGYTYGGTPSLLGIGANPGGQESFQGSISNVNIYTRALSAAEVKQNFNALRGRFGI
jgi:hypothetical protein